MPYSLTVNCDSMVTADRPHMLAQMTWSVRARAPRSANTNGEPAGTALMADTSATRPMPTISGGSSGDIPGRRGTGADRKAGSCQKSVVRLRRHEGRGSAAFGIPGRGKLAVGTEFLFGTSPGVLHPQATALGRRFAWAFNLGVDGVAQRIRLGRLAQLYYNTDYKKACKTVHEYADPTGLGTLEHVAKAPSTKN